MSEPTLQFQCNPADGEPQTISFVRPVKVITVNRYDGVTSALVEVQKAVDAGYWAAGYLAYEAAAFDSAMPVSASTELPLLWFGVYDTPAPAPNATIGEFSLSDWTPSITREEYTNGVSAIRDALGAGEAYQVNYTFRLNAQFSGDDFALYERLRSQNHGSFSCYMNLGRFSIISASPELFFRRDRDVLTTRPMKGTIARGRWAEEDRQQAATLAASAKDRAENIMIVDLLRNDLGRIAEIGSVAVPKLFEIERYPTLFQMTSTVTAKIPQQTTLSEIFAALFPCGSVTGAPKISAMKIISRLEPLPRQIYCGAIGYVKPNQDAVFSVAIRTMLIDHEIGEAEYGIGSAITWDSAADGEYSECLLKAAILNDPPPAFELLETMLLKDGEYSLLDRHMNRLTEFADHFGIILNPESIAEALDHHRKSQGEWKCRLLISKSGALRIEVVPLTDRHDGQCVVSLGHKPISKLNPFLYHKTTNRDVYVEQRSTAPDCFDVLLWNEEGELTEFTTGNLIAEISGTRYTPPLSCGLLPGTLRAELLNRHEIVERVLHASDLAAATSIWHINSVRGWTRVTISR